MVEWNSRLIFHEGAIIDKMVIFTRLDEEPLWGECKMGNEVGKPGWEGENVVLPVFFVHGSTNFVNIVGKGWVIAISQHGSKVVVSAMHIVLSRAPRCEYSFEVREFARRNQILDSVNDGLWIEMSIDMQASDMMMDCSKVQVVVEK